MVYVAAEDTTKHLHVIGVAVADRPKGPWADALGKPLILATGASSTPQCSSMTTQSLVFWGNNGCWYAVKRRYD